jgi:hypothetical protein
VREDSLKTEEKTVTVEARVRKRDESLDFRIASTTVHQCTNRCVSYRMEQMSIIGREALLRKEVIQPHLPVRLPCYDFTPITNPTFDGSFPCGLGHRLRVLPTFVV